MAMTKVQYVFCHLSKEFPINVFWNIKEVKK